jgi:hypothetical protein
MIKFITVAIMYFWYVDIALTWLDYFGIRDDVIVINYLFKECILCLNRLMVD